MKILRRAEGLFHQAVVVVVSSHFRERASQRGFSVNDSMLIEEFGDAYDCGQGDTGFFLGRRAAERALTAFGVDLGHIAGSALVVGRDGTFVTILRRDRPPASWKRRRST